MPSFSGRLRTRLPVAAKTALRIAGTTQSAPGSPWPPQNPPVEANTVPTFGLSHTTLTVEPRPRLRHLRHARQREIVEIGFHDAPILHRVRLVQLAHVEDDVALGLRASWLPVRARAPTHCA